MTELIWDGKYDDNGKRVAPLRVSLPFQTVETVNESAQQRQMALDMFSAGRDPQWRNRLIWGDKKYVLPSLLDEFAGKVNLVYIDPPFNVGADFSFNASLHDNAETEEDETAEFLKQPSAIELKAYRDTWGKGLTSYLQWLYETLALLRELLSDDGSIFVHIGPNMSHYARAVMDELFGLGNFKNEIYWRRVFSHNDTRGRFGVVTDTILFYAKSDNYKFNPPTKQHNKQYIDSHYTQHDQKGRYTLVSLLSPHPRPNLTYEYKGYAPPSNGWSVSRERMEELDRQGLLYFPASKAQRIRLKKYHDGTQSYVVPNFWDDIAPVNSQAHELTSYPTQKPEALLERILEACTTEGDLVLDCFCGSGTTAVVAEKLGRRWIAGDLSRFAIHVTRKRLLGIDALKPFVVQNLGKYERQAWIESQFDDKQDAQVRYREFILGLYRASPLNQFTWLHGLRAGRMVHVGSVDSPVTTGDLANIAVEFKRVIGTGKDAPKSNGVDILGWDFAFEMNEVAKQQASQAGLDVRFYHIPRDVMDKRAVEQGDIKFFELAALDVSVKVKRLGATLTFKEFVIPPEDVPQEVQESIKHWSQWVDYWAVDWDFKDDTFHNQWQTYRTRGEPDLKLSTEHVYEQPGEYIVVIKVIDILGNDTTKTVRVKVS